MTIAEQLQHVKERLSKLDLEKETLLAEIETLQTQLRQEEQRPPSNLSSL